MTLVGLTNMWVTPIPRISSTCFDLVDPIDGEAGWTALSFQILKYTQVQLLIYKVHVHRADPWTMKKVNLQSYHDSLNFKCS